jgi:transposase-like protein
MDFTETFKNVFPESQTQICVHQIRNSNRYVVWKIKKEFSVDMKLIYNTQIKESRHHKILKNGIINIPLLESWGELNVFFDFPVEIRK